MFNLVLGDGDVGRRDRRHPEIDAVSFTGSQGVGAQVGAAAMRRQARVQMEMGGKNPLVVLDDADLDRAVAMRHRRRLLPDRTALHRLDRG